MSAHTYVLKKGDTLWGVSRHFKKNISDLINWNDIPSSQVNHLPIGKVILLSPPNDANEIETYLTIKLLDLGFKPIKAAVLRLEYDGKTHNVNVENGMTPQVAINDHAKGLKVYFKTLKGKFELIADHKILPIGKKKLTLTSRTMKVKGEYRPKQGAQQQSTKEVARDLKNKNTPAVDHKETSTASTQKPQNAGTKNKTANENKNNELDLKKPRPTKANSESAKDDDWLDRAQLGLGNAAESVKEWFVNFEAPTVPAMDIPGPPSASSSQKQPEPTNKLTRTDGGTPSHVIAEVYAPMNLYLKNKNNKKYANFIINTADKFGFTPQALAALINAEAAKLKTGEWNVNSYNADSKAAGLTQFLPATWLQMCEYEKALVCQHIKNNPKLTKKEKIALCYNAEFAIDAAAAYAIQNLSVLKNKGIAVDKITDPAAKAKLAYLMHHEGPGGASAIIKDLISAEKGSYLLGVQLGKKNVKAKQTWLKRYNNNGKIAYNVWLRQYIDNKINVKEFMLKGADTVIVPSIDEIIVSLGGKAYLDAPATAKTNSNTQSTATANSITQKTQAKDTEAAATVGGDATWSMPLKSCVIRTAGLASAKSATFGMVRNGGKRAHQGVDLVAIPGTDIFAVCAGTVAHITGDVGDYGKTLVLEVNVDDLPADKKKIALTLSPNTKILYFFYAHLSEIIIEPLKTYDAGTKLGKTGSTGNASNMTTTSTGAHLHFEVRTASQCGRGLTNRLNPLPFLDLKL